MAERPPHIGFAGLAALGVDVGDALAPAAGGAPQPQSQTSATASAGGQGANGSTANVQGTAAPRVGPYQGTSSKRGGAKRLTRGSIALGIFLAVIAVLVVVGIVTEDTTTETVPSVGTNRTLSRAEIRYCIAEEIRLQGAQGALTRGKGDDVRRFNGMVDDYNSRCSSFRYRSGTLESARRDVEPSRDRLRADGAARFGR